ncbi:hypothetical protein H5071_10750 [Shewanella sp. SR41-2]|nr:hypothetical protein [Shewanella sp. SR41-2]
MNSRVSKNDCIAEISRFYKKYYTFCKSPDPDYVRDVLQSAYSLNDKLKKASITDFFDSEEFLAIKAIRNFITHQGEMLNESKSHPLISSFPIESDVSIKCLIPAEKMVEILNSSSKQAKEALNNEIIVYRNFSDIYPCIFNFGVKLFLVIEELGFEISSEDYLSMKKSIDFERVNGYPHFINGKVHLPLGGCVDDFINNHLITMEVRAEQLAELYEDKDGIFTSKLS